MSFRMKKRACFLLILILIFLIFLPWKLQEKKQPEGELVEREEILTYHRLIELLMADWEQEKKEEKEAALQEAGRLASSWEEDVISYKNWKLWFSKIEEEFELLEEEEEKKIEVKYGKNSLVLKEDTEWYLDKLWEILDTKNEIVYQSLIFLGDSNNVTDLEGKPIEQGLIFTNNGKWKWEMKNREIPWGKEQLCLTFRESIWAQKGKGQEASLENSWILESGEEQLTCFYKNYYIKYENLRDFPEEREQVADIIFAEGIPQKLHVKKEKVSGKVVKISEGEVELMNQGSYSLSEEIQYYQIYGPLKNVGRNEIPLGYDFTDFVLEEGKVVAALVAKDEKMESLRVLLKTPEYSGYFHPEIRLYAEVDLEILSGEKLKVIPAGQKIEITPDSEYFENHRIYLRPRALTGRTYFPELNRKNKGQGYLGSFEIERREEGLLLINEVLLEEYLYAVVPSEMPGYYPLEALKAQAISARTYAYQRMKTPGLSAYGANLDDSATYQVYNNIVENTNTTRAVRETKGQILYEADQPASTYYYSTSCGFGADASIWNMEGENPHVYLQAKEMTTGEKKQWGDLKSEQDFKAFITSKSDSHFENKEAWYRWSYEHNNMEIIREKLEKRLQEYPNYTFFYPKKKGETFRAKDACILEIEVKKRKEGGTIDCIHIRTNLGKVEVRNEYHIRAVLTDGESVVHLQDGNTYACNHLLPSAFFILETKKEGGKVTGIGLLGGGFGHGVGLSQNGAKNLANQGYNAGQILTFYYQGCEVRE